MIFIRTLAVLRSTICGTPPPLPFQQFGIAVPKAVAAHRLYPAYPGQSLLLRRNVRTRSPIIRGRVGRAAADRLTLRLGAMAGTAQSLRVLAERCNPGRMLPVAAHNEGTGIVPIQ